MIEYRRIQNLTFSAAEWVAKNPVLLDGEMGVERDTHKTKVGDGTTAWNSLPYTGTEVDLSDYYTKGETDAKFATGQMVNNLSSDLNRKIDEKVDTTTYEAKIEEVEGKIDNIGDNLATVATSGSYNDLSDKPYIPTKTSDLNNDSDYTTNEALEGAKQALETSINTKVDSTTYEGKINEIEAEIGDRYTKSEVDIKVNEAKGETGTLETKVDTHIADNVKHITAAERTSWNSKTTMAEVEAKDYATNEGLKTVKDELQGGLDTKLNKDEYETKISEVDASLANKVEQNEFTERCEAIEGEVEKKANQTDLSNHTGNTTIHITADERTAWNGKTTMAEVEAKDYATHAELTEVENKIPTNTEVWSFEMEDGTIITKEVYLK